MTRPRCDSCGGHADFGYRDTKLGEEEFVQYCNECFERDHPELAEEQKEARKIADQIRKGGGRQ